MPRSFDVYTLLMMIAVASFTMAMSMFIVQSRRREGLGLWTLGLVLHGGAYTLYALRGHAPDWASIVLGNVLLSACMSTALGAVSEFHGRALPWARMLLPLPIVLLGFAWWIKDYEPRVVFSSLVVVAQLLLMLWALWRPTAPRGNRGAMLFSGCYAAMALLLLARALRVALYGTTERNLMESGGAQDAIYLTAFIFVVIPTIGFILMTKERAEAENRFLAEHDALTGAYNRRALLAVFERDMAVAVRQRQHYALLLIDIDHFKAFNDGYGHLAGDAVLIHVVQVLQARVRSQDLVGRYGGEELIVLLPGTDGAGAQRAAQALCEAVEQIPCVWQGRALTVTVSIGACSVQAQAQHDWADLIGAADAAMYRAKENGRNRVQMAPALAGA